MSACIAPVEKFRDYIFKPGATHGKDHVFRSLGYDRSHSETLSALYATQAATKYAASEFSLSRADEYGQRVNIVTELAGRGKSVGKTGYLVSEWLICADGSIKLNTPFSGFVQS